MQTATDEIANIQALLEKQFSPLALMPEDSPPCLTAQLNWSSGKLRVKFEAQKLQARDVKQEPDFTIYIDDYATLLALLTNEQSPMDAVMQGKLRSDGYIVWTFRFLMSVMP